MKNLVLISCLGFALSIQSAELPEPVIPEGVGVNIHFTRGHAQDLDLIAGAGFKWVRMDFTWSETERAKGVYDWSAYEELTSNLERRGLRALYILDYSNPLYEETVVSKNPITGQETKTTASPQKPESVAAFARWAAAAAAHFKGRPIVWEIWNEPNIFFWQPKPDVRQYCELALATAKEIRARDPDAIVVGPATSEVPLKFLEDCFAAGLLDVFDAVTVHPYRDYRKCPETAAGDYAKLRELIVKYAKTDAKKRMPILSGEWGYATHSRGISLDAQAAFAVRQQLANLLAGVPLSIWYDWKNDGPDPDEREHNFGVVTADLKPKPAYTAIKTLTSELSGYRIAERINTASQDDYVLLMKKPGGFAKLVAWTIGNRHVVSVRAR
ncbi:MAG: cellulase family glycosylhydrolase, partial [Verrucomicrobiae bacterium]|nr:cellulase family glycosylhydrolase [Verrucomicrobiae bacterium]